MATQTLPANLDKVHVGTRDTHAAHSVVMTALHVLASLKLTVAMFALAIFLVFVGTLAQAEMDMWDVLEEYFRSYIAYINVGVFFPPAFFPSWHDKIPDVRFPFPGGALIGLVMVINLLSAHLVRFKVQARGGRLMAGIGLTALGILVTWLVIASGHNKHGLQGEPIFEWNQFWQGLRVMTGIVWLGLLVPLTQLVRGLRRQPRYIELFLLGVAVIVLLGVQIWMTFTGYQPTASSLRILWQLLLAGFAGLVLLLGCILVFAKRAGIVVIHAGIGLMMFSEFFVGVANVEERMTIREGETSRYADDIRTTELAIVDTSPQDHNDEVIVPRDMLLANVEEKQPIRDEQLPFNVEVLKYYRNADLEKRKPDEKSLADQGLGKDYLAKEVRASTGADADSSVDMAAAYVRLTDKKSGDVLGTHLVSLLMSTQDIAEKVTVGDKTYDLFLRFRRTYKPYSLKLIDVVREDYQGTATPRDYASVVRITDPTRNVDREVRIWMNNPLRYAGETFYQSSYFPGADGIETTALQVVRNTGWMIPYVSCMIVFAGLLYHFSGTLLRFLTRRERDLYGASNGEENEKAIVASEAPVAAALSPLDRRAHKAAKHAAKSAPQQPVWGERWFPLCIALLAALWLTYRLMPPRDDARGMDIHAFSQLPVHYEGRIKPLDTVARNSLRIISNKETFTDSRKDRQPAIRWLLDVVADHEAALDHKVVRIDSLEVLDSLGLSRRKGFLYAINEFRDRIGEIEKQVELASKVDAAELSHYQRKMLELDRRLREYLKLSAAFRVDPNLPDEIPTLEQVQADQQKHMPGLAAMRQLLETSDAQQQQLATMNPPLVVPPTEGDVWQPYATAWNDAYRAKIRRTFAEKEVTEKANPATASLASIFRAYRDRRSEDFNRGVTEYKSYLATALPGGYQPAKVNFEAFYNYYSPFFHAQWAYFIGFVLAAVGLMGWSRPLNRASYWLIVLTLVVHTFAIAARIYISGRPPVTNLYSSAVFIGWAAVIAGLLLEALYPMGIGNIIATITGFATLIIASFLAAGGETMPVLQAVLDTQFWLATHVVCISLGYSATFVAGFLGLLYIVLGLFTTKLQPDAARALVRMIYGTLCFALFFSFIGTVLGGLWADDSWGRFWGWDPKENGALIIVLWNALVLHARWDGMVRDRGLAVLAVGGNIATGWSWFGVNELGVGLHSYGFTEGVLLALGGFVFVNLLIMAVGCLPLDTWHSRNLDQRLES